MGNKHGVLKFLLCLVTGWLHIPRAKKRRLHSPLLFDQIHTKHCSVAPLLACMICGVVSTVYGGVVLPVYVRPPSLAPYSFGPLATCRLRLQYASWFTCTCHEGTAGIRYICIHVEFLIRFCIAFLDCLALMLQYLS